MFHDCPEILKEQRPTYEKVYVLTRNEAEKDPYVIAESVNIGNLKA